MKHELLSVGHKTGQHTSPGMMGNYTFVAELLGCFVQLNLKNIFFSLGMFTGL